MEFIFVNLISNSEVCCPNTEAISFHAVSKFPLNLYQWEVELNEPFYRFRHPIIFLAFDYAVSDCIIALAELISWDIE